MVWTPWKIVRQVLKKFNRITMWPKNATLMSISKTTENIHPHKNFYAMFIATLLTTATMGETTQINRCIDTQSIVHTMAQKGMKYWHVLQHKWALKTFHLNQVKEVRHKKPQIVWCHLYEMPRTGKSTQPKSRLVVARGWGDMGRDC